MGRLLRTLAAVAGLVLATAELCPALAADCWGNATGVQANCGAVQMFLNPSSQSIPVSAANPFPITGSLTLLASVGLTPTDRTIASTSGASQQIMAANAARHSLTVVNTGNANCGVNPTGGTAVIGGAGTLTLAPLGSYSPRIPTVSAVTVICTAAQPIYADEN